jgi:DNA-binding CsgD family transcriptional regulator
LQRLAAATDSTIRFDTVAERADGAVRVLVTVVDGDPAAVCDHAESMASVDAAERFGECAHGQLSLRLRSPIVESRVSRHGGRLLAAEFGPGGTTARIGIPPNVSHRPIIDVLTSRYEEIGLVSKRQTSGASLPDADGVEDILTERQCEILKTAYYGGYYETPRQVKGQDIAESFDISGPAVYNHLQAAHRTLLSVVFDARAETPE